MREVATGAFFGLVVGAGIVGGGVGYIPLAALCGLTLLVGLFIIGGLS